MVAMVWPGQSQEPRAPSRSTTWVTGKASVALPGALAEMWLVEQPGHKLPLQCGMSAPQAVA